ncbi:MAG: hypothetical protein GY823_07805 [Flavobacteriaceae bacterium]|nr:hypothetical protein [Flavobacteriaceae bacterium]
MPLPRISTKFLINELDQCQEEQIIHIKKVYLPKEVVEKIISWYEEFKTARIKAYYYTKFMEHYGVSLVKSSSRLKLYNRELKSIGMKYRSINNHSCTFKSFVNDTRINNRKYDYEKLKSIFI